MIREMTSTDNGVTSVVNENGTEILVVDPAHLGEFIAEITKRNCTRDAGHGEAEVPWSGERLCWDCADHELDLMAKAVQQQDDLPVYTRQDQMLDDLSNDLLSLADGNLRRVDRILELLTRDETWEGDAA